MKYAADVSFSVPKCKVTFILGNGFDLNLGMKTSYADVYASYLKTPSHTPVIESFKNELQMRTPYDKWADFEMGMAEYAQTLVCEEELVECVRDFKRHMVAHLENEIIQIGEKLLDPENGFAIIYALRSSIEEFYSGLVPNDSNLLERMIKDSIIDYCFLTFNYTDTLELVFSAVAEFQRKYGNKPFEYIKDAPLHIHGSLVKNVVIGVDNASQLKDLPYALSSKGKRAFIKPVFNEQYDLERVEIAQKMILNSSIICIYGFSMGESDKRWVKLLATWLEQNPDHHLVFFEYDTKEYVRCNSDEMIDAEEEKKIRLLKRLNIHNDAVLKQLHIPIGDKLFNFEFKVQEPQKSFAANKLPTFVSLD